MMDTSIIISVTPAKGVTDPSINKHELSNPS
jgi:hypothetical protein